MTKLSKELKLVSEFVLYILILALVIFTIVTWHNQEKNIGRENAEEIYIENCLKEEDETEEPKIEQELKIVEKITISTPEPIPIRKEYDIKLTNELQEYTYNLSLEYEVDYEFVLAIMYCESSFRDWVKGSAKERGLMQIHPINFPRLKQELGITDFMNPKQNILAGVFIISELKEIYNNNLHYMAIAYNYGISGQRKLADRGIHKTTYSLKVKRIMKMLKKEGIIR